MVVSERLVPSNFAGNEFYSVKGAFCKRYIGQVAVLEPYICQLRRTEFTFAECLIPESAVLETLVRLADSLFSSFAEYEI